MFTEILKSKMAVFMNQERRVWMRNMNEKREEDRPKATGKRWMGFCWYSDGHIIFFIDSQGGPSYEVFLMTWFSKPGALVMLFSMDAAVAISHTR